MRLAIHSNQLGSDPDPIVFPAHTAFQDVIDTEFSPNLTDALAGPFVRHA